MVIFSKFNLNSRTLRLELPECSFLSHRMVVIFQIVKYLFLMTLCISSYLCLHNVGPCTDVDLNVMTEKYLQYDIGSTMLKNLYSNFIGVGRMRQIPIP